MPETCIFNTRTNSIVDFVRGSETAAQAIERLAEYGPDLIELPFQEAGRRYEDAFKSPPVEIAEAKWHEMLGVLPPMAWYHTGDGESFKMSELTAGAVTSIYVRIGERYFSFSDDLRLKHADCCRRVVESDAFRNPAPPAVT